MVWRGMIFYGMVCLSHILRKADKPVTAEGKKHGINPEIKAATISSHFLFVF